jgi:hypothetical protein
MGDDSGFRTKMFFLAIITIISVSVVSARFQLGVRPDFLNSGPISEGWTPNPTGIWGVIRWVQELFHFELASPYEWLVLVYIVCDLFIAWEIIAVSIQIIAAVGEYMP